MTYCVSDVHGEYALFMRLMDKIGFGGGDMLIVLGDIIDKGKDSVKLLNALLRLPNCKIILGNHEYDFLKYYRNRMRQADGNYDAVLEELQGLFPSDGRLLTWEIVDMLEFLPAWYEGDDYLCVHAGIPLDESGNGKPLTETPVERLVYDRCFKEKSVLPKNSKCVIYGHTPVRYLTNEDRILFYPRGGSKVGSVRDCFKIHIDTGVYLSGVLGCLRVDDCKEFYVSK